MHIHSFRRTRGFPSYEQQFPFGGYAGRFRQN